MASHSLRGAQGGDASQGRSTGGPRTMPGPDGAAAPQPHGEHYKWIALSNTTLGILMAVLNSSIILIAMPDIFRGIGLDPLVPANTGYLLWMLMGFMVVRAVLVVSLGRLGDMFGRVRMYPLGFAVFTLFSILLSITWMHRSDAALYMIIDRKSTRLNSSHLGSW